MDKKQFIIEAVVTFTCIGILVSAFASGPNYSWGWKLIVALGQ